MGFNMNLRFFVDYRRKYRNIDRLIGTKSRVLVCLLYLMSFSAGWLTGVPLNVQAQDTRTGTIKGAITDRETREPLIGANIRLEDRLVGSATDFDGQFTIEQLPVGSYTLVVSYLGYETVAQTDVIVKSQRITFVEVSLAPSPIESQGITVESGYFVQNEGQPTSVINYSHEEIRRTAGSVGDVSRLVYGLPSVAKVSDNKNSLIVRGGGAFENGFYIDNIEIPNINHFPEQGSSGGPIGLVNVDFIRDVDFYSGGFSAKYGDRLSSIMDITFRKGNPEEFDGQLDMSLIGLGGVGEGKLGKRGSWMVSARRSYLDILIKAIGEDTGAIPNYSDFQGKVHLNVSPKHSLTFLGLSAYDESRMSAEDAIDNEESIYSDFYYNTHTAGVNWLYTWGQNGYSETSLAYTRGEYDYLGYETRTLLLGGEVTPLFVLKPVEEEFKLRSVNHYRINKKNALEFGAELKHIIAKYNNFYGAYNDELGNATEAYLVDSNINESKGALFLSYQFEPTHKFSITPGVRLSHNTYNDDTHVSPRLSIRYQVNPTLSWHAAMGVFRQALPLPLVAQHPGNQDLKDPVAYHAIVGIQKLLSSDTRLSLEAYVKTYDHFPLDPVQPEIFIADQVVQTSLFLNGNPLVDEGKAYSHGVELMIQKKLARDLYGLFSTSYFRSKYRDLNGEWRNRAYDNRFTFQAEGGYKPGPSWEFSARWLYAGGRPYTPFDEAASIANVRGVLDVNNINGDRLPAYHSLNVRFDRRFHYRRANLIFYLSIWNVYGRKNLDSYQWNEVTNSKEALEQWGMLPIFGLEFEF